MTRLPAFVCLACAIASTHARGTTCAVSWREARDFAESRAYTFTAIKSAGEGQCFVHKLSFIASASDDGPGVTCDLLLFGGKRIAGEWKLRPIASQGMPFEVVEPASPLSAIRLRISAPPRKTLPFLLNTVEFVHPAGCTDWKTALSE